MSIKKENTIISNLFLDSQIEYHSFLKSQFKRFFSSYTLSFNKKYHRYGSLFQKRFKRILIEDEDKYCKILTYIHHNSIHHGLTNDYGNWKFDSYNAIISESKTNISRESVLGFFNSSDRKDAIEQFIKRHDQFKKSYKLTNCFPRM